MDRNKYYGGQAASLNLIQMYERFRGTSAPPAQLGPSRDWNIDLVPKFMMANGKLVKTLIYTDVTRYLDFKAVDGSYVLVGGKVHKVPATDMEALASPLMGFFEKRRARNFFSYVQGYDPKDPKTHNGTGARISLKKAETEKIVLSRANFHPFLRMLEKLKTLVGMQKHLLVLFKPTLIISRYIGQDLHRMTMNELYTYFGLEQSTIDFIGHALALHRDDAYLTQPAILTANKIKLYYESLMRYV